MLDCLAIKFENIDMDHKMSCSNFSIQLKECTEKIMQLAKVVSCTYEIQKQPLKGVPRKRCSENMQQIYRRAPMPKCGFN